jgi:hypothetical protein
LCLLVPAKRVELPTDPLLPLSLRRQRQQCRDMNIVATTVNWSHRAAAAELAQLDLAVWEV